MQILISSRFRLPATTTRSSRSSSLRMQSPTRSSKQSVRLRFAKRPKRRSRTRTAPTVAPSLKAKATERESAVRGAAGQSLRQSQHASRPAEKVKQQEKAKPAVTLVTHRTRRVSPELTPKVRKVN